MIVKSCGFKGPRREAVMVEFMLTFGTEALHGPTRRGRGGRMANGRERAWLQGRAVELGLERTEGHGWVGFTLLHALRKTFRKLEGAVNSPVNP